MNGMRFFDPDDPKQLNFIEWVIQTDISNTMTPKDLTLVVKEIYRDIDGLINFGIISPNVSHDLRGFVALCEARQISCWDVER